MTTVRRLQFAALNNLPEVESTAETVANTIFASGDPKASFIGSDGFILTAAHNKLAPSENEQDLLSTAARRSLLAALMPTGKCGILTGPASSTATDIATSTYDWSSKMASFAQQHPSFTQVVAKVQKLPPISDTVESQLIFDVTNAEKNLSSALDELAVAAKSSAQQQQRQCQLPPSPAGLQYLVFVVFSRIEALCANRAVMASQHHRGNLADSKQRLFRAICDMEARAGCVGLLRPYATFATGWFSRATVEARTLTGECFAMCRAIEEGRRDDDTKNNSWCDDLRSVTVPTTTTTTETSTRIRQREQASQQEQQEQQDDNQNNNNNNTMKSFSSRMQNRIENGRSVCESARDDVEAAFDSIVTEADFNDGISNTARDVDRLVPALRSVVFGSSPFGGVSPSLHHDRTMAVAFDRDRSSGKHHPEMVSIVPSGETGPRSALERLAAAAANSAENNQP